MYPVAFFTEKTRRGTGTCKIKVLAQELPRPAAEWTSTPAVRAPSSGGKQVAGVQTNLTGRWGCAQVTGISRGRVTQARAWNFRKSEVPTVSAPGTHRVPETCLLGGETAGCVHSRPQPGVRPGQRLGLTIQRHIRLPGVVLQEQAAAKC